MDYGGHCGRAKVLQPLKRNRLGIGAVKESACAVIYFCFSQQRVGKFGKQQRETSFSPLL
jgi:hypothetical protein